MIKEFSDILIDPKSRLKAAMNQLNVTAKKILFVVDENRKMTGSLSDGDIRRWILSGGSLEAEIRKVCFKNTFFVTPNFNVEEVKSQMLKRKINIVPVLDSEKKIVQFLTAEKLFNAVPKPEKKTPIKLPVVIMAGGKGTRLDPFTKILPKPLIPIGDKAIIEIIIEKFVEYDVDTFYLSLNHKSKIIKSYFEELAPPYKIKYLYEDKPLGTAGSLKQLENSLSGSFIMTNCDIIIEADYNEVLNHHEKEDNDITVVASLKHFNIPYGICEISKKGTLLNIKEKPEYSFLVNTGMYIIKSEVLCHIPQDEFFHVTHLIEDVNSKGGKIGIFPINESAWIDIGEWKEYKLALEKFN
ncbi:MAG TPA: hypothetical protein DET40_18985 [Lentisphaeria bacterium]|nr:MAG: hypothetical protein A2X45_25380 [Lentisphaerae bacterium GWF2_50_93]HCE45632.1 hypothetical protein [Lentisphaeria bacterium]